MSQVEVPAVHAGSGRAPGIHGADAPLEERARRESALREIDAALAANSASAELHFLRGNALRELGRDVESRGAYVRVLELDVDHRGALCNLGKDLAANRNHAAARLLLERAVARYPDDLASHVALGLLLYQTGDAVAARRVFARALEIAPADPLAHTGMSFVLGTLGEAEQAAIHRRLGFRDRTVIALPYRGVGHPVRIVLLASTNGANVPFERFLDDRAFQVWIVVPEFHDPRTSLPDHDLVINAIGDVDAAAGALRDAAALLTGVSTPVINPPPVIAPTGRCENGRRLAGIADVVTPRAVTISRAALSAANAAGTLRAHGLGFPLLLRSPGFHGGDHFLRVESPEDLPAALEALPGADLIAIEFLDARGQDGDTRKFRVMMIDGQLYPLHLAIGQQWKLHYFSAEMAENSAHRAEEKRFLSDMAGFLGEGPLQALRSIQSRMGLDYGGIDFAIDAQGRVIVFEANATMIACPPDADTRWDYRRAAVERIDAAVRRMLLAKAGRRAADDGIPAHAVTGAAVANLGANLGANDLNFSAGPGALPPEVLRKTQEAVIALPETGLSVLGMSHRSAWFEELLEEAEGNLRSLLRIPETHRVLFLQGGSTLQFSMIPMNFAAGGLAAPLHVRSGYWSAKAIDEARCVRPLRLAWDGADQGYRCMPVAGELESRWAGAESRGAAFLHYVSNETVEGVQCVHAQRVAGVPLIADMSSDFLSRPVDVASHALIYAHAQKNLGPAGVTVCVIDEQLLERIPAGLPPMLDYRTHVRHGSNYNTPPVFGIYVMTLVTRWLRERIGGVDRMEQINRAKAERLYATLDRLRDAVLLHADPQHRSAMNASFRFRAEALDAAFLEKAEAAGFSGLAGHRSLGGIRVSMYNAVTESAVARLCGFLEDFARTNA